jgi:deoxyadenosine/deoxycytidine kinase
MRERQPFGQEFHETDPMRKLHVTIIGPACSGKSTILHSLGEQGYSVHPEPANDMFPVFLKDPKKYAFNNQLNLMTQLIADEIKTSHAPHLSDPYFAESGVLATDIYNRYLHDKHLISDEEYSHLNWLYLNHLVSLPVADVVVYISTDNEILKERAIRRDGKVAMEPEDLKPYWERLLKDLRERGVPVVHINTGIHSIDETSKIILDAVVKVKSEQDATSGRSII